MAYQHIKVPAGGQKITVQANGSLNVPDQPIIPFIEGDGTGVDITPVMIKVVDAAVAKAYGGKRKISWMEVYAGEKADAASTARTSGCPKKRWRCCRTIVGLDQGAADHAGRRRHPLAQRGAAPGARPVRLPAPGALFHGRAQPGEASRKRPTW